MKQHRYRESCIFKVDKPGTQADGLLCPLEL